MSFPWEIDPEHIIKGKRLGGGNFGDVYRGECRSLPVAIKVPRIQELDEEELFALKQEVQIWSAKPHPNIVQFIGACTIPNQFQIVTELLDGDLESLLRSKSPLTMLELMNMAYQIALGMNWLHRSSPAIIHRDLKTANILYRKTGNTYEIKISDFGLAQIKPRYLKQLRDPKDGARGTPLYMAPEVLLGKPFNEKADVYSFGIVLWEIVERTDPFSNFSDYDTFRDAVALRGHRPPVSNKFGKKLRQLMESCWDSDPSKRPDFEQIAEELLEVIVHVAISDKMGRKFWVKYFLHKKVVPWRRFAEAFYGFLGFKHIPCYDLESSNDFIVPDIEHATEELDGLKLSDKGSKDKSGKGKGKKKKGKKKKGKEEGKTKKSGDKLKGSKGEKGNGSAIEEKTSSRRRTSVSVATVKDRPPGKLTKKNITDLINYRCLKSIVGQKQGHDLVVDINWFGSVLMWFGPLKQGEPKGSTILDEIRTMLSFPWFHGDIDANEAGRRLRGMPEGTFLIRFSLTVPGSYTISRMVDCEKDQVANSRIKYVPGKGFTVEDRKFFDTLTSLIHSLKNQLGLTHACGGSQYVELFKVEEEAEGGGQQSNHYYEINSLLEDQHH